MNTETENQSKEIEVKQKYAIATPILLEVYGKVCEHIKFLESNILEIEEEDDDK